VIMHRHAQQQADNIQLGTIVVTPADAETGTVNLGAILVIPSDADWRYAEANGVQRPAMTTITLAPITVQPTTAQLVGVVAVRVTSNAHTNEAAIAEAAASSALVEALEAFSPRQYLDTDATLRVLNALVFERSGR